VKTKVKMLTDAMIERYGEGTVEIDSAHASAMIARGFAEEVITSSAKKKKGALTEKARSHMAEAAEKRKAKGPKK
jgi:hypothetical protein